MRVMGEYEAPAGRISIARTVAQFNPARSFETWPKHGWEGIVYEVCQKHKVKIADVMSGDRRGHIVACRWEIIWRIKRDIKVGGKGIAPYRISRLLNLDHASVRYALERMDGRTPEEVRPASYGYKLQRIRGDEFSGLALTPMERRILSAILTARHPPTCRDIAATVYADDEAGGPDWGEGAVQVHVFNLRKKLLNAGWVVENGGYRIRRSR